MYTVQKAKQQIVEAIKSALRKRYTPSIDEIVYPPNTEMGDLSFPCFAVAKGVGGDPVEVATELAAKIGPKGLIKEVKAVGPYVNFVLDQTELTDNVLEQVRVAKDKYGNSTLGKGKRIMVEYAQPNTHKELHVGHLRNILIGESLIHVLRATGYEVVAASYIGDVGAHVAKCLWGILNLREGVEPEKGEEASFLQEVYAEAEKQMEKKKKVQNEIRDLQNRLEEGDKELVALWKKTRKWSLDEFKRIFKELGAPVDVWYFESDVEKKGKKMVQQMLKDGIAEHSQGAVIADLEKEGLGAFLLLRSDGGALYSTKDLALAFEKEKKYNPDKSIYVVDSRQELFLKQLFATLKKLGVKASLKHLSYEFVKLKGGTMSSRKGTVISLDSFLEQVIEMVKAETLKRHEDWPESKVAEVARRIALSAVKFDMLKIDPAKVITFDPKSALSFDGFTGPYVLYSLTRARSILRKAESKAKANPKLNTTPEEKALVFEMARLPELVQDVSVSHQLSKIAEYLFSLAKAFSDFYNNVPVIQADDDEIKQARLALIQAYAQVVENGLKLLGIEPVDEM